MLGGEPIVWLVDVWQSVLKLFEAIILFLLLRVEFAVRMVLLLEIFERFSHLWGEKARSDECAKVVEFFLQLRRETVFVTLVSQILKTLFLLGIEPFPAWMFFAYWDSV